MKEELDVISMLEHSSVLAAVQWAYSSAVARTLNDYSEAAGHDITWLGTTRYTLFRDRLDRVFGCERYLIDRATNRTKNLDILRAELSGRDIDNMPELQPGLVCRSDLNGSPGWRIDDYRFLLSSYRFGGIDEIKWTTKSPTKQAVASQPNPEPQPSLFDDLDAEVLDEAALGPYQQLHTLIVAHALSPDLNSTELFLGRPRLNVREREPWYWRKNLLTPWTPSFGSGNNEFEPKSSLDSSVPDAPVRLKPIAAEGDS